MLISNKLNSMIRVLLANAFHHKSNLTVSELAKEIKVTHAMVKRLALKLEKSGYVNIRGRIKVIKPLKLMHAWGFTYSIKELQSLQYVSAERPQYAMTKITNWARKNKTQYAFTLFSATEYVSPYVAPTNTYLYINPNDVVKWEEFFKSQGMMPAEKEGNVVCYVVNDDYFTGTLEMRGSNIVSLPQLYADLKSFGGRGEDAAQQLEPVIRRLLKDV